MRKVYGVDPKDPKLSGVSVCWKLKVVFHDSNGDPYRDFDTSTTLTGAQVNKLTNIYENGAVGYSDDIVVPAQTQGSSDPDDGWWKITDGSPCNIYLDPDWQAAVARGFFGGDAVLSVKIESSDGSTTIMPQQDYKFRIAGENPDPGLCKSYINSVCGNNWFAYAIAKAETNGEGGRDYYNNFLDNGGGGVTKTQLWPGHEGHPDWNNDSYYSKKKGRWIYTKGSGGYGLFQLTYQPDETNFIMPRGWIWNWQSNTMQGIADLNAKATPATNLYNYLVSNAPSIQSQRCPTSGNDIGVFNSYEGILVCLNNGNDGFTPFEGKGKSTPWKFNISTGVWTFTGNYAIKVAGFVE